MNINSQKGGGSPLILLILGLIIIVGVVYYITSQQEEGVIDKSADETVVEKDTGEMMREVDSTKDAMMKEVDEAMMKDVMAMTYEYSGELADVTDGSDVLGINTEGTSNGVAKAIFKDASYMLLVTFDNLPDPQGTDFYEGWVVRKGADFSVISTGKVNKTDGKYSNTYSSGKDLTDHTFYVLTIEPDDGDPAPADHILEGTMTK